MPTAITVDDFDPESGSSVPSTATSFVVRGTVDPPDKVSGVSAYMNPPSPLKETTFRSGFPTLAPRAVAKP